MGAPTLRYKGVLNGHWQVERLHFHFISFVLKFDFIEFVNMKHFLISTIALAMLFHQASAGISAPTFSCYTCGSITDCIDYTDSTSESCAACFLIRGPDDIAYVRGCSTADCTSLASAGIDSFLGDHTLECCEDVDNCNGANTLFAATISMSVIAAAWHFF